jgi:hypothetical protein
VLVKAAATEGTAPPHFATAAMASGGAGTSPTDPAPSQLFSLAEPDAAHTLGGLKDDVEPDHPSVIGAIG